MGTFSLPPTTPRVHLFPPKPTLGASAAYTWGDTPHPQNGAFKRGENPPQDPVMLNLELRKMTGYQIIL